MTEVLTGGLYSTKAIPNYMNTCVIDATILSIINSEAICDKVISHMRNTITIDPKVLITTLSKEIVKNKGYFNILKTSYDFIGAYMVIYYGKSRISNVDKWKTTLDLIRSHILFIANREHFEEMLSENNFDDYKKIISINLKYKYYCDMLINKFKDDFLFNEYTYTSTDLVNMLCNTNIRFIEYKYNKIPLRVPIENILSSHKKDIYLRFPTYRFVIYINNIEPDTLKCINIIWDLVNTFVSENSFICTDMILREVIDSQGSGHHLVYYNYLECKLETNDELFYVPPHKLRLENRKDKDGRINKVFHYHSDLLRFYVPEVLHFQKLPNITKEMALAAGFDCDDKQGVFNLRNRLMLIKNMLEHSKVHPLINTRHDEYISDITEAIKILDSGKTLNHNSTFSFIEEYISDEDMKVINHQTTHKLNT